METVERPQRGFERSTGKVIPGEKGDAVLRTGEGRGGVEEDGWARSAWWGGSATPVGESRRSEGSCASCSPLRGPLNQLSD